MDKLKQVLNKFENLACDNEMSLLNLGQAVYDELPDFKFDETNLKSLIDKYQTEVKNSIGQDSKLLAINGHAQEYKFSNINSYANREKVYKKYNFSKTLRHPIFNEMNNNFDILKDSKQAIITRYKAHSITENLITINGSIDTYGIKNGKLVKIDTLNLKPKDFKNNYHALSNTRGNYINAKLFGFDTDILIYQADAFFCQCDLATKAKILEEIDTTDGILEILRPNQTDKESNEIWYNFRPDYNDTYKYEGQFSQILKEARITTKEMYQAYEKKHSVNLRKCVQLNYKDSSYYINLAHIIHFLASVGYYIHFEYSTFEITNEWENHQKVISILQKYGYQDKILYTMSSNHRSVYTYYTKNKNLIETIVALNMLKSIVHFLRMHIDSQLMKPLSNLIYIQQSGLAIKMTNSDKSQNDIKIQESQAKYSKAFSAFLKHFDADDYTDDTSYTIKTLLQFIGDVKNNRPVSSEMLPILLSEQSSNKVLCNEIAKFQIENKLSFATSEEINKIKEMLPKNTSQNLVAVYKVNHSAHNYCANNEKLLIHGTKAASVLSILHSGLLEVATLEKTKNTHYTFTGAGLGSGIYFAKPKDIEKSLNYTNGKYRRYCFMASVKYNKVYEVTGYCNDLDAKGCDLVYGNSVGSYDRDEFVAKSSKQVDIKYLLEFE